MSSAEGRVRSHHVASVTADKVRDILVSQIHRSSHLNTDEAQWYVNVGKEFARHDTVNHGIKEYVRGEATTNTVEAYFSLLKRGLYGTYHHVSAKHLKRYLGEFDFRHNHRSKLGIDDPARAAAILKGIEGKRLTYRRID